MVSPSEHQYQTAENIPNQYLILGEIFFGKTQKKRNGKQNWKPEKLPHCFIGHELISF